VSLAPTDNQIEFMLLASRPYSLGLEFLVIGFEILTATITHDCIAPFEQLQTDPLLLRDSEGGKNERASDMWDHLERVKNYS
jgi:hypothetical protein